MILEVYFYSGQWGFEGPHFYDTTKIKDAAAKNLIELALEGQKCCDYEGFIIKRNTIYAPNWGLSNALQSDKAEIACPPDYAPLKYRLILIYNTMQS